MRVETIDGFQSVKVLAVPTSETDIYLKTGQMCCFAKSSWYILIVGRTIVFGIMFLSNHFGEHIKIRLSNAFFKQQYEEITSPVL